MCPTCEGIGRIITLDLKKALDPATVAQNSSNHHLVPKNDEILNQLSRVRVKDLYKKLIHQLWQKFAVVS
jgi:excinuclease UvrABC ATPase subunit